MEVAKMNQMNLARYIAELQGLYGMANSYEKLGKPMLPGIPDIPKMITEFLKRLVKELLEKLRPKIQELIMLIMTRVACEVIPIVNEIVKVLNFMINVMNQIVETLMPLARSFFYVIVALSILYIVPKIIVEVMLDFGAGMGAVTVFTTKVMRKLMWISNTAKEWNKKIKPIAYAILANMRKILQAFGFLTMINAILEFLRMFSCDMFQGVSDEESFNAEDWANAIPAETSITPPLSEELVDCTYTGANGETITEPLTPDECIARGGTFPGLEGVMHLNDLDSQIASCLSAPVDCCLADGTQEELNFDVCFASGGEACCLAPLQEERNDLCEELGNLCNLNIGENEITSLLYTNSDVTIEKATQNTGNRYGFYGEQFGGDVVDNPTEETTIDENTIFNVLSEPGEEQNFVSYEFEKGGKVKRKNKPKIKKNKQ